VDKVGCRWNVMLYQALLPKTHTVLINCWQPTETL